MEEEREIMEMPFGKRYRVGNFEVLKVSRALSRKESKQLRDEAGIPEEIQKHLRRNTIPYIMVSAISGIWSISYTIGSVMYAFIESEVCDALELADGGEPNLEVLRNLFTMMYADTAVLGDGEYLEAKAAALKDFLDRQRVNTETEEDKAEDDELLESMRRCEEMTEELAKEREITE